MRARCTLSGKAATELRRARARLVDVARAREDVDPQALAVFAHRPVGEAALVLSHGGERGREVVARERCGGLIDERDLAVEVGSRRALSTARAGATAAGAATLGGAAAGGATGAATRTPLDGHLHHPLDGHAHHPLDHDALGASQRRVGARAGEARRARRPPRAPRASRARSRGRPRPSPVGGALGASAAIAVGGRAGPSVFRRGVEVEALR